MTSLRARLLALLLALLGLAALLMGAVTYRTVLAETEALFDYQLRQMALSLRDQGEIAPDQVRALTDEQLDFVVQIWTADGRGIYASRPHSALPTRAYLGFAEVAVAGEPWRTFSVATHERVIQVAQPLAIRHRLAADAALRSVRPLLIVSPLLALAMWWLALRALEPLRSLARALAERRESALAPLPAAGLPDEVAPLVEALNGLLARLAASFDSQRAFVADAAHELRSPLTALKLQLQLLQRAPDEAARAEAMAALAGGIDRAARLVEQLLMLARSEAGAPALAMQPLDLAETVRHALADTLALARARGVELALQGGEQGLTVRGDAAALAALVRNLADNAVRHAPAGSTVQLALSRPAEGGALLQVDDAGPGIPPEHRERVFDRFVRRAGHADDGSGLGLAIVRTVARAHGATVALGDSPLGGLRVSVAFPAASSSSLHAALTPA